MAPTHWQLKAESDLFVWFSTNFGFGFFAEVLFPQSWLWQAPHQTELIKFTLEIKHWCPYSPAECGFDLKVHVITEQTPHIYCRVDLFLVAGITFFTCRLQAGKFSTINHGEATSISEFLWKQSCGGMFTTTDTIPLPQSLLIKATTFWENQKKNTVSWYCPSALPITVIENRNYLPIPLICSGGSTERCLQNKLTQTWHTIKRKS